MKSISGFNWRRKTDHRKALRQFLAIGFVRALIDSLAMVYLVIYFKSHMTPTEVSTVEVVSQVVGLGVFFMLQTRQFFAFIVKNSTGFVIATVVASIIQSLLLASNVLLASIINKLSTRFLWRCLGTVTDDLINAVFIKRARTQVGIWCRIHNTFGAIAGAVIALVIDQIVPDMPVIGLAIMLVASDTMYGFGEWCIMRSLKKLKSNRCRK